MLTVTVSVPQEEKAQRTTPEKSPPPKRRGQRRLKGKRRSDPSLAGEQQQQARATAGSMGGECDTDLATAIRQALRELAGRGEGCCVGRECLGMVGRRSLTLTDRAVRPG